MTHTDASERTPLLTEPANATRTDVETGAASRSRSKSSDQDHIQRRPEDEAAKALEDKADPWTRRDVLVYGSITLAAIGFGAWAVWKLVTSDNFEFDWRKTLKAALGGGLAGAAAMVIQVLTLMPLRTIMNYQYRYGTSFKQASRTLYEDGGFARYYSGLYAALVQGPIARFGDTAANAGIRTLFPDDPSLPPFFSLIRTVFASVLAALFRLVLSPVEVLKTTLQVQGPQGWALLANRVKVHGIGSLWYGAFATAGATFVGHYPWFATYNLLKDNLPLPHSTLQKLLRQAVIGFCASVVSDTVSNSLRVVKTYRQVNATKISYTDAARAVIAADGLLGLFGRGLSTRILANGLQGLLFSVLWQFFMDLWKDKTG